jgi:hypothetical protein
LLVQLLLILLLAMLGVAWAGLAAIGPAAATRGRMHQATAMHADFVHLRTVSLFLPGVQRRTLLARCCGHESGRKKN